jgi:arginyl-tRNA synthetase
LFLRTTDFGDDKDRVLIKSDGTNTYFMPDICYSDIKFNRGYDKCFSILGADHKSYGDRMHIAIKCLGYDDTK